MQKHTFRVVRVIENDCVGVEADTRSEAFVKLVNDMASSRIIYGRDAVIREYVDFGSSMGAAERLLDEIDWDTCDLDRDSCEPNRYGSMNAAKIGKHRCCDLTIWDIRMAFDEYQDKSGWRGLDAESAIRTFIRFLETGV